MITTQATLTTRAAETLAPAAVADAHRGLKVYLIRHGETAWSRLRRHTGRTDIAMTAHGEQQALTLAPALGAIAFAQVWVSPSRRARDTCRLAGLGSTAHVEPALLEWDYGDYEGLLTSQVHEHRPQWTLHDDGCPAGELPAQVATRADWLIASLLPLQGNVALFSHGQFCAVLAARWLALPVAKARHFSLSPASVSVLGRGLLHPGVPELLLWNAVAPSRDDAMVGWGATIKSMPEPADFDDTARSSSEAGRGLSAEG